MVSYLAGSAKEGKIQFVFPSLSILEDIWSFYAGILFGWVITVTCKKLRKY